MIRLLEWDTAFFGFKIGSVDVSTLSDIPLLELQEFDLVYIFAQKKDTKTSLDYFLADEKRTYVKKIKEPLLPIDINIISVRSSEKTESKLLDLAYQAGEYSRFKIDKNFPAGSFKKLYKCWMLNSLSREIAKKVFVFKTVSNNYSGMITLGVKNNIANIGLIAVDSNVRSIGIGSKLLHAAELWAINELQTNEIQVVTQGANEHACAFYKKNEFCLKTKHFIYHWWSPKFKK